MDMSKLMSKIADKKQALKTTERTIKPNPGMNEYVILPGWRENEPETLHHDFGAHYIKDAAGTILAVYPCADKTYGKPCAVCSSLNAAMQSAGNDATLETLKEAASRQVYLINVLALGSDKPNDPQILEVSKTVYSAILDVLASWAGSVFDANNPQVVTINREGKGLNTRYTVGISPKKVAMPKDVMKRINNLDEYVKQESEDQQRRALSAIATASGALPAPSRNDVPTTAASVGYTPASQPVNVGGTVNLNEEFDDLLSELDGTKV